MAPESVLSIWRRFCGGQGQLLRAQLEVDGEGGRTLRRRLLMASMTLALMLRPHEARRSCWLISCEGDEERDGGAGQRSRGWSDEGGSGSGGRTPFGAARPWLRSLSSSGVSFFAEAMAAPAPEVEARGGMMWAWLRLSPENESPGAEAGE